MRFIFRFIGFFLLVIGFVSLVIDGARIISSEKLAFTPLGLGLEWLLPESFPLLRPFVVAKLDYHFWDFVFVPMFQIPTFAAAGLLGMALLWVGRRPNEPIGFPNCY